jgi:hypothetical protein
MTAPTLLTYGPGAVDETLTLAMSNMIPGIKENIFADNTALGWLNSTAKERKRGGASLSHGIHYAKSTSGGSYSRYGAMNVTPQDNLTRDQWAWKQYYWTVAIDGFTERVAGKGEWALADALQEKRDEAENSLKDQLEVDVFKASPGSDDLRSLAGIVAATGTEGQINATTNSWNQSAVVTAGSWGAGIGRTQLTNICNTISKRMPTGPAEILISDQTSVEAYEGTLISQYRYTTNKADIGLTKLLFKEIPWIWSVQATSGVIYVLHSDAIKFYVNSDTDFIFTGFTKPANQDAKVGQILFAAALTAPVRRKLGRSNSNAA